MPKKIAIVVWSKTGNTKLMADSVKKGVEDSGFEVDIFKAYNFNFEIVKNYDKIALGCPAMGSETLEDTEFLHMYKNIKPYLKDKKVFFFGSYGWGDGKWMQDWEEDAINNGIKLFRKSIIAKEKPNKEILDACFQAGIDLANAL